MQNRGYYIVRCSDSEYGIESDFIFNQFDEANKCFEHEIMQVHHRLTAPYEFASKQDFHINYFSDEGTYEMIVCDSPFRWLENGRQKEICWKYDFSECSVSFRVYKISEELRTYFGDDFSKEIGCVTLKYVRGFAYAEDAIKGIADEHFDKSKKSVFYKHVGKDRWTFCECKVIQNIKNAAVGDTVIFGTYPHGENGEKDGIRWNVLAKKTIVFCCLAQWL